MRSSMLVVAILSCGVVPTLRGQVIGCQLSVVSCRLSEQTTDDRRPTTEYQEHQRTSIMRTFVHYGKWLTAAVAVGATAMAQQQHTLSRKDWDALLDICRTAADACLTGPDGRYLRADAEALYQRSRSYDLMANRYLMAAQLSLVTTTALFIIDLNPGDGPDNIPYPSQIQVGVGYRLPAIR